LFALELRLAPPPVSREGDPDHDGDGERERSAAREQERIGHFDAEPERRQVLGVVRRGQEGSQREDEASAGDEGRARKSLESHRRWAGGYSGVRALRKWLRSAGIRYICAA